MLPQTAVREVLTEFSAFPSTGGDDPRWIAIERDGGILIVDRRAGTNDLGALFRIRFDPETGTFIPEVLSDFGHSGQGLLGGPPQGVAVEADGQILVVDIAAGTSGWGLLVRVDPGNGARVPVSDFGDRGQGPLGQPQGVAIEADVSILVTDQFGGTSGRGALVRVDPGSGDRVLLSDFGVSGQGPLGQDPFGVAVMPSLPGTLIVVKAVVNDNGGSGVPSDWTITVTGTNPSPATFAGAPAPGTAVTLDPGTYSVAATGPAGYSSTPSADCAGMIAAGETKTCTITSDDEPLAALPDLVVSILQALGSVLRGRAFTIQETTANTATVGAAGASIAAFYLSLDQIVGPTDIPLGSRAVADLAPGASASGATSVTVPASVTPGTYFIIAVADVNGIVAESGESDNTLSRRIKVR